MTEQDGAKSSTKKSRSRKTNAADQQNEKQARATQRPANDDKEAWKTHWKQQGQPWRTEPEIDAERQKYLAERRSIKPDIEQGSYPFKDIKLSRADVEWLLATHENGRGPVDWSDESHLNDESQRKRDGLDLRGADLSQENLRGLPLVCMRGGLAIGEWRNATEEQRNMAAVRMQKSRLYKAQLQGAILDGAQMQKASLFMAQLQGAILCEAQLDGVNLIATTLSDEKYGTALLADIRWGEINLAAVDWTPVKMLGDECEARQQKTSDGTMKYEGTRINEFQAAVRANRQLAVVLRDQGLNEEADRFAYRAQLLQREVWRRQHRYLKYIGSWLLWLLAGHGYRPLRSILWYLVIIFGFALAYYAFGHLSLFPPDAFIYSLTSFHGRGFFPGLEHRTSLHDPLIMLAAIEAVVGLFIEISFIATFTQRFFGR